MVTGSEFWRHSFLLVDLCNSDHQGAFLTLARDNNLLVFAPFERGFETVEAQAGFWPLAGVAAEAGALEHRSDVLGISESVFFSRRRQFGEVDLTSHGRAAGHKHY
jgi:hypothetical protein